MKMPEAIMILAGAVAAQTATREGMVLCLPSSAMDRLRADATWLSRFGVAVAGDTGALFMHSPIGVIEIRENP